MKTTAAFVAIALTCTAALAQPPGRANRPTPEKKSPTVALLLSLGSTLTSGGLIAYGATDAPGHAGALVVGALGGFFAPSFGEWYAAENGLTIGLGLRATGLTLATLGVLRAVDDCDCSNYWAVAAIGGAAFLAGTITDIAMAPGAARNWNAAHVQVVPTVMPNGAPGLGLAGAF